MVAPHTTHKFCVTRFPYTRSASSHSVTLSSSSPSPSSAVQHTDQLRGNCFAATFPIKIINIYKSTYTKKIDCVQLRVVFSICSSVCSLASPPRGASQYIFLHLYRIEKKVLNFNWLLLLLLLCHHTSRFARAIER